MEDVEHIDVITEKPWHSARVDTITLNLIDTICNKTQVRGRNIIDMITVVVHDTEEHTNRDQNAGHDGYMAQSKQVCQHFPDITLELSWSVDQFRQIKSSRFEGAICLYVRPMHLSCAVSCVHSASVIALAISNGIDVISVNPTSPSTILSM